MQKGPSHLTNDHDKQQNNASGEAFTLEWIPGQYNSILLNLVISNMEEKNRMVGGDRNNAKMFPCSPSGKEESNNWLRSRPQSVMHWIRLDRYHIHHPLWNDYLPGAATQIRSLNCPHGLVGSCGRDRKNANTCSHVVRPEQGLQAIDCKLAHRTTHTT